MAASVRVGPIAAILVFALAVGLRVEANQNLPARHTVSSRVPPGPAQVEQWESARTIAVPDRPTIAVGDQRVAVGAEPAPQTLGLAAPSAVLTACGEKRSAPTELDVVVCSLITKTVAREREAAERKRATHANGVLRAVADLHARSRFGPLKPAPADADLARHGTHP